MALPEVTNASEWLRPEHLDAVVEHLTEFATRTEGIDLLGLATDPYGTLGQHPTLSIEHSEEPEGGCAVYGHYQPNPPTIHIVRATTFGRDHFTLLHEYAHHLQQHDPQWADIEWRIRPDSLRLRIVEEVANAFASTVLIPNALLDDMGTVPTAREIAELHQSVRASRQAAIVRVTRAANTVAAHGGPTENFFVSLAHPDGVVVFSQSVGDSVFPPPRDSRQPDIERLFNRAIESDGQATGVASTGITYSSGKARSDIRLDLHIAHDGDFAFVVGTAEHRYGTQQWSTQIHVCPAAACGTEFVLSADITRCPSCGGPECPECGACDCESVAAPICQRCFTELSASDRSAGRTEHDECPW